jgi:FkbM family methyltransferase
MRSFMHVFISRAKIKISEGVRNTYRYLRRDDNACPISVERAEQIFYINYLKEGMIVFDVGANIGELTLMFSRFIGESGMVYAFEASTSTFEKLSYVCASSMRENIYLSHLALSDSKGCAELYIYPEKYSCWNTLANRQLESYGIDVKPHRREHVCSSTVDIFCQERGISKVDLLKIDVEGAEYQVLLGAQRMMEQKRIRCCVFEFGATTFDMGNTPAMIEEYLSRVGYKIRNVISGCPCFPGRESSGSARFAMHIAVPV